MTQPDSKLPQRTDALLALVTAALALSALETIYAWAERWLHAPIYFALSAGLTLALALAFGLLGSLLRLPAAPVLAAWIGTCLGLRWGWIEGVVSGAIALAATWPRAARALAPGVSGVAAAFALACAYLKGPHIATHLGHKGDALYESVGAALVLAGVLPVLPPLLGRIPNSLARGLLPFALGIAVSLTPRLERGDGEHRQPPPGYAGSAPRVAGDKKPNVFVLVMDTVRADHLPAYGYGRDTMPELERLRQEHPNSVVFPHAFANGTWTVPSHGSLFTGRLPSEHGAHFALDGSVRLAFGIADSLPTLAERMQRGGYATLAGYGNHWLRSVQGFSRGFERYLRAPDKDKLPFVGEELRERFLPGVLWEAAKGCARAKEVNETLLSLVEPWSAGPNPLFVFANYVDAHGPYAPPAPFRGRFGPSGPSDRAEHLSYEQSPEHRKELMARYDEELSYLDHELAQLFASLEQLGLLRDSWVFVTADHGEAFGEHGVLEHGTTVFNEVTHVPLIVFPPEGQSLAVTDDPVSIVDVSATVAAIGGERLEGPGRDLRSLTGSGTHATAIEFYGDPVKAAHLGALAKRPARAVVMGHYKLIVYQDEKHLYDIEKDPGENVDLAEALPTLVKHLEEFLPPFLPPTFHSDHDGPTPEALDALRGLGYVGGVE